MNINNTEILILFKAYTAKEINEEQYLKLQKWLNESSENNQLFSNYLLFYKRSRRVTFHESLDQIKAWDKIVSKLEQPLVTSSRKERSVKKLYLRYAAAAVLITLLSTTYFLKESIFNNNSKAVNNSKLLITPGTDKAILTLGSGKKIALKKGESIKTQNATSNGEQILYNKSSTNKQQKSNVTTHNTLTIPRGGQYQVTLTDGTKVWLNSESQLKFPVNFQNGKSRTVELVYGEAYFDVSPSTNHSGDTFQVVNKGQNVEVLGTEFNIKAYKDEDNIYTTLVEGKVAIRYNDIKQNLLPNQQSVFNVQSNSFKVSEVNVYNSISWREGIFSIEEKSLEEIMKVLSRWYDMDVVFKNPELKKVQFLGKLKKKQQIDEILSAIKFASIINDFEVKNKTIILE